MNFTFIVVVVCKRNIYPTSGRVKWNGREIPGDASFIAVTPSACQGDRRRQHVRHLPWKSAQCRLHVRTRHMRRVCCVTGSLSYVQETDREEDYAVQLTEVLYDRVVLETTLFWGNMNRFCSRGGKFRDKCCARYLVVTKPCVTLQRISTRDASISKEEQCFINSLARRLRRLLCLKEHS